MVIVTNFQIYSGYTNRNHVLLLIQLNVLLLSCLYKNTSCLNLRYKSLCKRNERTGTHLFWSAKNLGDILNFDKSKSKDFLVASLSMYD